MRYPSLFLLLAALGLQAAPTKVFILVGQSNMEGHAKVETQCSKCHVRFDRDAEKATFKLADTTFALGPNEYSDWISVSFGKGQASAHGICKLRVTSFAPGFSFYVSPLHIDPRQPAMPATKSTTRIRT